MSRNRVYTDEFRREAVKLAQTSDKSYTLIAQELGMSSKTLSNWVRAAMKAPIKSNNRSKESHYQELLKENAKLKRELKRAQQEREILKKAAAYFASLEK